MILRPPISTHADKLYPYTTLCRSFVVPHGRSVPLLDWTGGDAVGSVVGLEAALDEPVVGAVRAGHDAGRVVLEPRRQPALERVRRFDEVVVDRDQGVGDCRRLGIGQQMVAVEARGRIDLVNRSHADPL